MRTQVLSTSRDRAMAQSDQFTNGIPPVPVFRSRPYFRKKALKNRVGRHDFDHEPKLRRSVHPANLIAWRDISSLCACPLVSRDILTILVRIDGHVVKADPTSRHKVSKYG